MAMLTLPIKLRWLDLIATGEKLEEYREITPYYAARFKNVPKFQEGGKQKFYVKLQGGYSRESPFIVVCCWLDMGPGRPEWGAEPGKNYFRLHIDRLCFARMALGRGWPWLICHEAGG